ncbi:MAG: universal stress protein [Armatimonadota bacterium]|nr:universal stress protein [Armatimonadota bacterium]MDR7450543.1 universal stress protein [Armatimonadota bacterium]MDR7466324.1 universal stress protein [Armatimonadota bacterium]MDR7493045.1 universal stress protein [Armatimonadota bacterium]MDR7498198.1 universal stress protein [Armatimonadota bacterium]
MTAQVAPRRILVPTDFSPGAEGALAWAQALGSAFGAEVVLLHVLDLSIAALAGFPSSLAMVPAAGELLDRIRGETAREMANLAARLPGARSIIREGTPRTVILEVAGEIQADLIVMGTHGRTGLTHLFFGSVAEHVVRHSRIPVLIVRQRSD